MSKTLSKIVFNDEERGFLLKDEKGRKFFYAKDGVMLVDVRSDWKVSEVLGSIETEAELTALMGCEPSAFLVACPYCGKESIVGYSRKGWSCGKCKGFIPAESDSTETVH